MKITFIVDNFPPEVNAPAIRAYEHVKEWVKQGEEVDVITCNPNFPFGKIYEGYKNKLLQKENIEGIKVYRLWSYMAANKGFILRSLDFVSFAMMSFFISIFIKSDVIITTSPQFFVAISTRMLAKLKRKPFILEIRDLYPEQILASTDIERNFIIKILEREELKCYKSADSIITVTNSFKEKISEKVIDKEKIYTIKNGINLNELETNNKMDEDLLKEHNLNGKKVVGYFGTHGMSQNLQFIINSLRNVSNDIHFLFIGDGSEKKELIEMKQNYSLNNVSFLDQMSRDGIARYYPILDLGLVPLRNSELYKTVIPSKIFEFAAQNIPILLGVDGEARELVEKYNAGIFYEPENERDFIEKLNFALNDKELYKKLQNGCKKLAEDHDRAKLANNMLKTIRESYEKFNNYSS